MTPQLFGQLTFDGLSSGLVFIILACGLVIIASTCRMLFMAYGVFYTIGAYMCFYGMVWFHLPYFVSLIFGTVISALLAMISYVLIFQRLQKVPGSFLATLIASMGLSMVLTQGGLLVYGTSVRSIPTVIPGILHPWGLTIIADRLLMIGLSMLTVIVLFWVYEKTRFGRSMRAVSIFPEAASIMGINPNRIFMLSLGLGCALAGLAGGVLAPSYGMTPAMGNNVLWTVMLITMLGGIDSLVGAVVAGVIIGLMLAFGQFFIGGAIQIYIFLIIGVILYFKPVGLLGRGTQIEL